MRMVNRGMTVILITAILCLTYYVIIVSYAGIGSTFSSMWLAVGVILLLCYVGLLLDKKYGYLELIPKWIYVIIAIAALVVGVLYMSLFGIVLSKMHAKPDKQADYVIVLGAQIKGTRVTKSLKHRLEEGIRYYQENNGTTLVVSGGMGPGEDITEAEAMYGFLIAHGVPKDKIIMEDKATNTNENLKLSYELILKDYKGEGKPSVAICSNNFHIARSLLLAKKLGLEGAMGLATIGDKRLELNYMVRDSLAIFKEFLKGNI